MDMYIIYVVCIFSPILIHIIHTNVDTALIAAVCCHHMSVRLSWVGSLPTQGPGIITAHLDGVFINSNQQSRHSMPFRNLDDLFFYLLPV